MKRARRTAGHLSAPLISPLLSVAVLLGGSPVFVALKESPDDNKQLVALIICAVAGCVAQIGFLLAHTGDGVVRPPKRWFGEVALGGLAAYIACGIVIRYGPDVNLPQLIVPAILGGFLGQRLLLLVVDAVVANMKLPKISWGSGGPTPPAEPPPAAAPPAVTPPEAPKEEP